MSKFTLLLIGTIAIGMFALPGVVSTFSGSHDYIAPENVDCTTCHPEVYEELLSSVDDHTHAGYTPSGEEWTLDCVECHTVSGIGDSPAVGHAAQKVDCDFCHDRSLFSENDYSEWAHYWTEGTGLLYKYEMECDACHRTGVYDAGSMFIDDVYVNIINNDSAHVGFFNNADNDSTLLGASESCIGCHAHVTFTFTQPLGTANMTYNPETGEFAKE